MDFINDKLLLLLILTSIAFSVHSETQNSPQVAPSSGSMLTQEYSFKQLNWDSSKTLNGYSPSLRFYLPLSKALNAQKVILHLKVAFSPLLTQGSKVEVRFNDALIKSIPLPADKNQEMNVDIELPLTRPNLDWQTLDFTALFSSNLSLCSPDIWIYVSPDSSLTISSLSLPFNGTLNEIPFPFIDKAALEPVPTLLLLPNSATLPEIFLLFDIAFHLGQWAEDAKMDLSMGFKNESLELLKKNNVIFLGMGENLGQEILPKDNSVLQAWNSGAGLITLSASHYNPKYAFLAITGKNFEALAKASNAFIMPEFQSLAADKMAIIYKAQLSNTPNTRTANLYKTSLKELGYSDTSVSGLGKHTLTFNVPLPNDRVPSPATIKSYFTAPISEEGFSQITLLVNGKKQSSLLLEKEYSAWTVKVKESALKPGINQLKYLFNLHLPEKQEQCSSNNHEVWATIHAETDFESPLSKSFPITMLNQLPVPFEGELFLILPDEIPEELLSPLTQLIFKMGQLFKENNIKIKYQKSSEINENFIRKHSTFIIGTSLNNRWVDWAEQYMPVQIKGNERVFKYLKNQLNINSGTSTGLLELLPSPWSSNTGILLITANDNKALKQAILHLTQDKIRAGLNGNIALINDDNSIDVLNSYDNKYMSTWSRFVFYLDNLIKNSFYFLKYNLQIFVYLIVLLVPLLIYLRQRKKSGKT